MRNLALALGALGLTVAVAVGACSDDVETTPTPTTTTGSTGGSGGSTSSTTTTTPSGVGGGGASCAGVGGGPCDQACCKIENECDFGYPIDCGIINTMVGDILNCTDNQPIADCNGGCILAADCIDLPTLIPGATPDPELQGCLLDCNGGTCMGCVATSSNCLTQLGDCMDDATCAQFLECMRNAGGAGGAGGGAPCEDPTCRDYCENLHSSAATTALITCTCTHCAAECSQCGSGGGGGAGGA